MKLFYSFLIFCIVAATGNAHHCNHSSHEHENHCKTNWTFNWANPLPYDTPSPINISLSEVDPVYIHCPFKVDAGSHNDDDLTLWNTGSVLKLNDTTGKINVTYSGGILKDTYIYEASFLFWSRSINQSAGSTVDGDVAPIFGRMVYYNSKYGNFENCLSHRDGLVIFEYGIVVRENANNQNFEQFYSYLKKVLYAGQSVTAPGSYFWKWMVPESPSSNAYVYPGSYKDAAGNRFDCAIVVSGGKGYQPVISVDQYNRFIQIKKADGNLYESLLPTSNRGARPIVYANHD